MNSIHLNDIKRINVAEVDHREDGETYQPVTITDCDGGQTVIILGYFDDIDALHTDRDMSHAKLDEHNSNVVEFERTCLSNLHGKILRLEHLDRLPGPDGMAKRVTDAIEAFCDMCNETSNTENKDRAKRHREAVRIARHEYERSNKAEIALCNGLIAALYLFEYRYTSERYMPHFFGAVECLSWWDALNADS